MGNRIDDIVNGFISKFENQVGNDVYVKENVKLYTYGKYLHISKGERIKLDFIGLSVVCFFSYRDNERYTIIHEHFLDDIKYFETQHQRRKRIIKEICQ